MTRPPAWLLVAVAVAVLLGGGTVAVTSGVFAGDYTWATVTVVDADTATERATVDARIADTFNKRVTGLSTTDALGPNEGMLFVHTTEGRHGYVMRDMAFPLDIVFVDADGEITTIHHAAVDAEQTFYGTGRYVLELPSNYTTDNDITVGDQVELPTAYR
ncbi:DUF192 domain-containing protein [Halonotius aquaticus]|uniref:DUF192 domain-containing protein n=1 Tax=Halonotius aquaticus TaxID=2216978 RepID=A0A3A6Q475_9EURY|nr:DUF192 domain-containing protein [Halonotius aquaticus]RJX44087.1 DUF192 domain-containing protein [Halonotius aquaticus]